MNIKVCGITSMKQLQQLEMLNIDFAGLVFHKDSPRYVGNQIPKKEIKTADMDLRTVGVFVNESYDTILHTVEDYGLDMVQLHGDETAEFCEAIAAETEVIKVFRIDKDTKKPIDHLLKEYDDACDYYLFDTASTTMLGGTGEKFDWQKIKDSKIEKPFFLSGGISPEDTSVIKKLKHPDFYGVDLNSHFEKEPGIKDMALLLKFITGMKNK
ncbi:MAG: phosphoribosylanthranilate isomerase [Ferruginibacter sp.]